MLRKSILYAISALLVSSAAQGATLTDIKGRVLVNQGEGYSFVKGTVDLKPGDRVLVRSKSTARLLYGIDCERRLRANRTLVVPDDEVCRSATMGDGSGAGDAPRDMPGYAGGAEFGAEALVVAGPLVLGVAAAVMHGHDKPASP